MAEFAYQDLLPVGEDVTPYRLLTREGVSTLEAGGRRFVAVAPAALTELSLAAM
jgi:fumarate hydratase class I